MIMKEDFVKVYEVKFMQYTNCMKDTVWDEKEDEYMNLPEKETILVPEYELDKFRKFGDGFESTKFVGYMIDPRKQITILTGDFISNSERVFFNKDKEEEE